jgi:hypothetical protein
MGIAAASVVSGSRPECSESGRNVFFFLTSGLRAIIASLAPRLAIGASKTAVTGLGLLFDPMVD